MADLNERQIENILISHLAMILSLKPQEIKSDTPLHTLGVDSLSFVELLVFIEKRFNLKLMESGLALRDFYTVAALTKCIVKLRVNES
jgi:acyl carrier protein